MSRNPPRIGWLGASDDDKEEEEEEEVDGDRIKRFPRPLSCFSFVYGCVCVYVSGSNTLSLSAVVAVCVSLCDKCEKGTLTRERIGSFSTGYQSKKELRHGGMMFATSQNSQK